MTTLGGDSIDDFANPDPSPYARCPDCGCRFVQKEPHAEGCGRAWMIDPHDSEEWRAGRSILNEGSVGPGEVMR